MFQSNKRRLGLAVSDLVAAGAAMVLVAAAAPPALQQMRVKMRTLSCANNLRVVNQAANVYAEQFNGKWYPCWDQTIGAPGQWPYTMRLYANGMTLADGKPIYDSASGWWGLENNSRPGRMAYNDGVFVPAMHCQEFRLKGQLFAGPMWYDITNYTSFIPCRNVGGNWRYDLSVSPMPDLMTHPSTTLHLFDMVHNWSEGDYNVWATYGNDHSDPHGGKSNFVFADGHTELMSSSETTERMWQDQWTPEQAAGE